MTPTKEQYQKAAAFCGSKVDSIAVGGELIIQTDYDSYRMWRPLTWQDGGPLLAKVEKWIGEHSEYGQINTGYDSPEAVHTAYFEYTDARASGNEQQWLEAGFLLSVAIQESVG